jgi:hypothetical protein
MTRGKRGDVAISARSGAEPPLQATRGGPTIKGVGESSYHGRPIKSAPERLNSVQT